jgi:hypothetical protein
MKLKEEEKKLLARYLLGDLSESEKAQIEARFFAEDEYYEELLVAEDELIYDYLRGALATKERKQFAAQIAASPKRLEKVQFVKALMAEATENPPASFPAEASAGLRELQEPTSWWRALAALLTAPHTSLQSAMAAAILLLAIAGFWLWLQTRQLNSELQLAMARQREFEQSARDSKANEQNQQQRAAELQKEKVDLAEQLRQKEAARQRLEKELSENAQPPAGLTIPFTLEQGIPRGESEDPKLISVPRRATSIRLTLDLGSDDGNGRYRAEFQTRGGTLVWSQDGLASKPMAWGSAVVLNLPAEIFRNSEYDLTLKRVVGKGQLEDVAYYYFKIIKQ